MGGAGRFGFSRLASWPSTSPWLARRLRGTLDTVGGWFCRLSENAPGQEIGKDPAGVRQDSPGRKPWELRQVRMSALNGRCRPLRLFQVGILAVHVTMARAPVFPARPFQGRPQVYPFWGAHDPFRVVCIK